MYERNVVRVHGDARTPRIKHADIYRRTVDQAQIGMANIIRLAVRQANAKCFKGTLVQVLSDIFRSNHRELSSIDNRKSAIDNQLLGGIGIGLLAAAAARASRTHWPS